jgi:hypothetical protein
MPVVPCPVCAALHAFPRYKRFEDRTKSRPREKAESERTQQESLSQELRESTANCLNTHLTSLRNSVVWTRAGVVPGLWQGSVGQLVSGHSTSQ